MRSFSRVASSLVASVATAAVAIGVTESAAFGSGATLSPERQAEPTVLDAGNAPAAPSPTLDTAPGVYLVTLTQRPAAAYTGRVRGYPATRPRPGRRFDRTGPAVLAYQERLVARHRRILDRVGNPPVLYHYTVALDGFAAELTSRQVKQLRSMRGVALVERSTKQSVDTVDSARFLGLARTWRAVGGPERAGRGTVVGVVDTGIWPENAAFAGLPQPRPGRSKGLPGFHGICQRGEQWEVKDCDDKVVSARWFVRGFGRGNVARSDFLSPRDGNGHGSQAASVAAGNIDVRARIDGQGFGPAPGMAPGARIAVYKACWAAPNPDDDGCTTADTVAAVDRAVADGVDVIGYSISGARETVADSVQLAFLNASAAGVFVAASAGNEGPDAGRVGHPSPWVTTVGASTHRLLQGSVVLDDRELVGAMVSDRPVPPSPVVLASDVAAPGADPEEARTCEVGSLDAEKTQGKLVVCDRGATARVDKSEAVARAGGAAMILANVRPDGVEADFHSVPTVHLDRSAAMQLKGYVAEAEDPVASIDPSGASDTPVPQIADFSGRGPTSAAGGDLLKPDLTAPGVSVVAAVAPPSDSGRLWDLASGSSMSTAHVAGLAALVVAERPTWSPAAVKSAMMTTAYDLRGAAGPFSQGAGHVDPTRFLDPGLVLDIDDSDYRRFLAGQGFPDGRRAAASGRAIRSRQLNLPSVAVGDLVGTARVIRTVTNVSGSTETFDAHVSGLDGLTVTVQPQTLELAPGESAQFTVVLTADEGAQLGVYANGDLTWTGLTHEVSLPVVARPVPLTAPDEVSGSGESGTLEVGGTSGTPEPIELGVTGLVSATPVGLTLVPGSFDLESPEADEDTASYPTEVPVGTELVRFELDGHNTGDDLDLYVYRGGELVAQSASGSVDETLTLVRPEAGEYTVYVHSSTAANGSTTTAQFYSWVVSSNDAGNLDVAPELVGAGVGEPFRYRISWEDLPMTTRWFGAVGYGGSGARTLVTVR